MNEWKYLSMAAPVTKYTGIIVNPVAAAENLLISSLLK